MKNFNRRRTITCTYGTSSVLEKSTRSLYLTEVLNLLNFVVFNVFLFASIATVSSQEASGLSLGKPLEKIRQPGDLYLAGNKGDWTIRCITETNGKPDKCEIQQLLFLNEDTPIAEISLFKLPAGEVAIAAANVMVPLETLLTNKFRFAFSKELVKEFPYSFCIKNVCFVCTA